MNIEASVTPHVPSPSLSAGSPATLRAERLDRDAALLLRLANEQTSRETDFAKAREAWRKAALIHGRRPPVRSVEQMDVPGPAGQIAIRVYTPLGDAKLRPAFMWCHGGGFVTGGLDTSDGICRALARAADIVVVAASYRLAPEHSLYDGRADFLAVVEWVSRNGAEIGVDAARLAVGGDSAGGNISAAVTQECVRRGGPKLDLQVLVYPATNLDGSYASKIENAEGYMLTAEMIDWLTTLIPAVENMRDPWLSPIYSPDKSKLPPAVIVTAGFDPIRDDGLDYAAQLRDAGVPVELLHYAGQFHGFLNFDATIAGARDALKRIAAALSLAFAQEPVRCRTIEIAARRSPYQTPAYETLVEPLVAAIMVGSVMRRTNETVLRKVSPTLADAVHALTRPLWLPAALLRRRLTARIHALEAKETFRRDTKAA